MLRFTFKYKEQYVKDIKRAFLIKCTPYSIMLFSILKVKKHCQIMYKILKKRPFLNTLFFYEISHKMLTSSNPLSQKMPLKHIKEN